MREVSGDVFIKEVLERASSVIKDGSASSREVSLAVDLLAVATMYANAVIGNCEARISVIASEVDR